MFGALKNLNQIQILVLFEIVIQNSFWNLNLCTKESCSVLFILPP
jgi:hypothetical protein